MGKTQPMPVSIRRASPSDAVPYLAMLQQLDCETEFMMYEPGERTATPETVADEIRRIESGGGLDLVVEAGSGTVRLVGFLTAERGFARRNRHTAHIVVGLLAAVRGQGIGSQLFAALEEWAHREGVTRLELTVMTHNDAAVRLYEKMGFVVEGYRERALYVNGRPVNEFSMARLLKPHEETPRNS